MSSDRSLWLAFIVGFISLSSCNQEANHKAFLQNSVGELAELVVVYHSSGSTDAFKKEVEQIFSRPNEGLPPPSEPRFKVLFTDESYFKGYFKEHHNLFILLTADNLDHLAATFSKDNRQKVLEIISNKEILGFNKKDVWAINQNVSYITAENEVELLSKLKRKSAELLSQANNNEMETASKKVLTISTAKDSLYKNLMSTRGYAIRKPNSYRVAVYNDEYLWMRKETRKFEYGVMVYDNPYTSEDQFDIKSIIAQRTALSKRFIPGPSKGSFMVVDTRLEPYFEQIKFKGRFAISLKGWWRVEGDYMAGPFILYAVYDEVGKRIITVEGFVYGPNEPKVKALRELEIILNSLDIK